MVDIGGMSFQQYMDMVNGQAGAGAPTGGAPEPAPFALPPASAAPAAPAPAAAPPPPAPSAGFTKPDGLNARDYDPALQPLLGGSGTTPAATAPAAAAPVMPTAAPVTPSAPAPAPVNIAPPPAPAPVDAAPPPAPMPSAPPPSAPPPGPPPPSANPLGDIYAKYGLNPNMQLAPFQGTYYGQAGAMANNPNMQIGGALMDATTGKSVFDMNPNFNLQDWIHLQQDMQNAGYANAVPGTAAWAQQHPDPWSSGQKVPGGQINISPTGQASFPNAPATPAAPAPTTTAPAAQNPVLAAALAHAAEVQAHTVYPPGYGQQPASNFGSMGALGNMLPFSLGGGMGSPYGGYGGGMSPLASYLASRGMMGGYGSPMGYGSPYGGSPYGMGGGYGMQPSYGMGGMMGGYGMSPYGMGGGMGMGYGSPYGGSPYGMPSPYGMGGGYGMGGYGGSPTLAPYQQNIYALNAGRPMGPSPYQMGGGYGSPYGSQGGWGQSPGGSPFGMGLNIPGTMGSLSGSFMSNIQNMLAGSGGHPPTPAGYTYDPSGPLPMGAPGGSMYGTPERRY